MKTHTLLSVLVVLTYIVGHTYAQRPATVAEGAMPFAVDGEVHSLAAHQGVLYAAGPIYGANGIPGPLGSISLTTGRCSASFPAIRGVVNCIIPDGNGGAYVGGYLAFDGYPTVRGIIRLLPDLRVDTSFRADIYGQVLTMALHHGKLYIGGLIKEVHSQPRQNLACLDAETGAIEAWAPTVNKRVYAIVANEERIYVGGSFDTLNGSPHEILFCAEEVSGRILHNKTPAIMATIHPVVNHLYIHNGLLYLNGHFSSLDRKYFINHIAYDISADTLTEWNPNFDGSIQKMIFMGDTVLMAGTFDRVNNRVQSYFALFNHTSGELLDWNPTPRSSDCCGAHHIQTVILFGDTLIVGGYLMQIAGQEVDNNLCKFNYKKRQVFNLDLNIFSSVILALHTIGDNLLIGGVDTEFYPQDITGIAAMSFETGMLVEPVIKDNNIFDHFNSYAEYVQLVSSEASLYLSGSISNELNLNGIAQVIPIADSAQGNTWQHSYTYGQHIVRAISHRDVIYAAGDFDSLGGQRRLNIAALDAQTGRALEWAPELYGPYDFKIYDMELGGNTLYVSGNFNYVNTTPRSGLAGIDTRTGLVTEWKPNLPLPNARQLATDGRTVFIVCDSLSYSNTPRRLLAVDARTGQTVHWQTELDARINTLVVANGIVYLGGQSGEQGFYSQPYLAAFDARTGQPLPWPHVLHQRGTDGTINTILPQRDRIFVGGSFETQSGPRYKNIAPLPLPRH